MAASITLSAIAVAADGKTVTATIGGGNGTYSISSVVGLMPHLNSTGGSYVFYVTGASVSGTTLTMTLSTTIGSGETIQFDITTASTLTDTAANTPTGQTAVAVTNGSTVTVVTITPIANPEKFELNGTYTVTTNRLHGGSYAGAANVDNATVEFVADATEVSIISNGATATTARVDGATASSTLAINGTGWVVKPISSGLAAGNHLFLVDYGDYFGGVRLVGGAAALRTVATTKATLIANAGAYPGFAASTPVTLRGAYTPASTSGWVSCGTFYVGLTIDCQFSGSGIELATVTNSGDLWAISVDGGQPGSMKPAGDASVNALNQIMPLVSGLASGTHTVRAIHLGGGAQHKAVRVINGTGLSVASSVGDTTLTVSSSTTLAVGDWIRIDQWAKREWRKITAISGTVVTLNAALAIAHAVGAAVTSYMAPAGTLTAWSPQSAPVKKVVGMGDSNTQGANEYGLGGPGGVPPLASPDANGNYYVAYDPRMGATFLAADALNYEFINLGIQGHTSTNMAARNADYSTYPHGSADAVTIWAGTNDINGTSITPATYQANIESMVTAATPYLKAGGVIVLMPPGTPTGGVVNAGGLSLATALSACQAVAANHPTTCIVPTDLYNTLVAADYNSLHYMTSGRQKVATALTPYINGTVTPGGGTAPAVLTGMFAAC